MTWSDFIIFAVISVLLWMIGAVKAAYTSNRSNTAVLCTVSGLCVYLAFIVLLWHSLQRPPLRTLGETRLWYSFFMMMSGLFTYLRWRYKWILLFSTVVASVFITLNILRPELHDQTLMPALQSYWFIPHVTVYMFSYSVLGCAFLLAVTGVFSGNENHLPTTDSLAYIGTACLSLGMLSGALWAKEAWGNYWNWDPKETWAAITWGFYLLYIHLRLRGRQSPRMLYALLIIAFIGLQMCWYGINYLPAAQKSIHVYGNL